MPVGLVNKDSTKVTDDVDDTKHEAIGGEHREIGTRVVARDGSTRIFSLFIKRLAGVGVTENFLALLKRVRYSPIKELVDGIGTVHLDVDDEDHCYKNGKDNNGMDVRSQESSLESSGSGVQNDTPRNKESSNTVVNSS